MSNTPNATSPDKLTASLIELINPLLAPLGFEAVHVEVQNLRQKNLRVFIDRLEGVPGDGIGIEDCVVATRALDEPLDQIDELNRIFKGPYELEVSSPGVDRPLRQARDFQRFSGREARIHVYRPLTAEEIGNPGYLQKNPKQKNFMGKLAGLSGDRVLLVVNHGEAKRAAPKGKADAADELSIPLPLIAKANLEPQFDFGGN